MHAPVAVRVLGPVAVATARREVTLSGVRLAALLARLAIARGRPVSGWQLRDDVWAAAATSDSTLRVAIGRLRSALGDDGAHPVVVRREGDGYLLDVEQVWLDAAEMEELIAAARRPGLHPLDAQARYEEALALWRGLPFGELGDLPFVRAEVDRLLSLHDAAVEERLDAAVAAGGGPELLADLEAAVAEQPLRERRTAALMVALYRAGRQADALAAYRRLETTLGEELGLIPSDDLRRLEARIVSQDPVLLGSVEAPRSAALAERAAASARAAVSLARHGALAEADRLSSTAVAEAREAGDPLVLNRCLVSRARTVAVDGQVDEARTAMDEAATIARHAGDGTGLAQVAMVRFGFGLADDELLVDLVEPLELLQPDAPRRVELLCAAMHQVALTGGLASAQRLVDEAVNIAGRTGDMRARAVTCVGEALLASLRGAASARVLELAADALDASQAAGDPVLVVGSLHTLVRELLASGDVDGVAAQLERFDAAAAASLLPFALVRAHLLRASVALARGDLRGAERHVDEAAAVGARLGVGSSTGSTGAQRLLLLLERGSHDTAIEILRAGAGPSRSWSAALALVLAEAGRHDEARQALDPLLAAGPGAAVHGYEPAPGEDGIATAMLACEAASLAGWDDVAPLAAHLEPQRGRMAIIGHATLTLGPVDRVLGLVELADGRADDAVGSLRRAIEISGSAVLWAARSQVGLAEALLVRGRADDGDEACGLLDAVAASGLADPSTGSVWLAAQHARAAQRLRG